MTAIQVVDSNERALTGLRYADFDAVAPVESVWEDSDLLVKDLHRAVQEKILYEFAASPKLIKYQPLKYPNNPLIDVFTGIGGAGKTGLLNQIREKAIASGSQFVLVDMTGVNRFQPTVCLYLIQSLLQPMLDGRSQLQHVLAKLHQVAGKGDSEEEAMDQLSVEAAIDIELLVKKMQSGLRQRLAVNPRALNQNHRADVLRALMLLCLLPGDARSDAAHAWLQGGELDQAQADELILPRQAATLDIIRATTWFMSFRAPTLLAFDQMDVMVHQFRTASLGGNTETAAAAKAVVIEMSGGLAGLWEQVYRTQIIISCLQETWLNLKSEMLAPVMDRFCRIPIVLGDIPTQDMAKKIVELRLTEAYANAGFVPPSPTWPFRESFFQNGATPRLLLQRCAEHRDRCVESGRITETEWGVAIPPPPPREFQQVDEAFSALLNSVKTENLLDGTDQAEESLGELLQLVCQLLPIESPLPKHILIKVDPTAGSSKSKVGLHTRLRLIMSDENEREELFCFRALQHPNANSFQARLKAAITDSGVDTKLPFRRLVVLRNRPIPSGAQTKKLVELLDSKKGRILPIAEDELRIVLALKSLREKADPLFLLWLPERKPLGKLEFVRQAFSDYYALLQGQQAPEPAQPEPNQKPASSTPLSRAAERTIVAQPQSLILGQIQSPLGERLIDLPLAALTRHVLIRAGSGGGKTVLLKRLIECAALAGVPSIVLDPGNDLAFLGDAWPAEPGGWLPNDAARAAEYHDRVEVVVWTPGRNSGRPLSFSPLPDFKAVIDDPDDFEAAVMMAAGSLSEATGASRGANNTLKIGLLTEAIRHFARQGGQTLPELVAFLRELPQEAQGGIAKAWKLGQDMADTLQGTLMGSKTLMPENEGTNVSELLGIGGWKTRVSIVSLAGLSESNGDQLAFVNQLAVLLFTWIRQNPAKQAGQVRGLLVVDEARDFVPSVRTTSCKDSLMRVAAQARKYGFGLMLATQNPTDIDHKVAGQCATQFFGRAASPNVVDAMRAAIAERGGNASDLTQLGKGQFYFCSSEGQKQPVKIQSPICLSYHPDGRTLSEAEILTRARKSV